MVISDQCVVSIHYQLTDKDGDVLDTSENQDPLHYLHGSSNIIPGLEKQLVGKKAGDELRVVVQPEDGYGLHQENLVQEVPRAAFSGIDEIQPGMRFQADSDRGPMHVIVTEVTEQTVTVDGNHPLAGQVLTFDVRIESVREATAEEIAHGHPHQGGHCH